MNVFEKIQAVSNEIMSLEKDMMVGKGAYAYKAVSDFSVTKAVKEAEKKYGIISIPARQEMVESQVIKTVDNGKEKITYSFLVKMTVLFINTENPEDKIEIESFGHGLDSGDKGTGKASTYARKYALLNAYKIATGEDPDADASPKDKHDVTPSYKRVAVEQYLMSHLEVLQRMLQHFNVGELDDLSESQINTIYNTYKERGIL